MTRKLQAGFGTILLFLAISCTKENNSPSTAPSSQSNDALTANKGRVFEKLLTVYTADKTNSTTVRFRSASKEQLDKMALANFEFTLVKTPESATNATDAAASTARGDKGISGSSNKEAILPNITNEMQDLPKDAIIVDLPYLPESQSVSIDVKSKNLSNEKISPALWNFYYRSWSHHIRVTNLHYYKIYAYFYYYFLGWHGPVASYGLSQNWYAWYKNCIFTVGAGVSHGSSYSYRINYWSSCF